MQSGEDHVGGELAHVTHADAGHHQAGPGQGGDYGVSLELHEYKYGGSETEVWISFMEVSSEPERTEMDQAQPLVVMRGYEVIV